MMKKRILPLLGALMLPMAGQAADDIDALQTLVQTEFRNFSEDLGAALSYKALAPAEPTGITGFDIGVEVTATSLEHGDLYDKASSGGSVSTLPVPKLHLHKGLPFNIDVGVMYSSVPGTNITLTGGEIRWAFIEGGVAMPAVAVRATMSTLGGVDQLELDTQGVELSISKGFAMLTPYAGIGTVSVDSKPAASTGLKSESFSQDKVFAGLNMNFGLMNLALEGDKTGDASTYGVKFGFRW